MAAMRFSRPRRWCGGALVCAGVALLAGCGQQSAGTPVPGVVGIASPSTDGSSTDLPYDEYAPPSSPSLLGFAGLGFPNLGPPDPDDPGGDHARQVLDRHRGELSAIPGWQADGVSRRDGHSVIVVMTRRPVPAAERIAALEDVPLVYEVAGPFTLQ